MFKNGKENNTEYIDKEELERTYRYQEKVFDAKMAEQQAKINELVDYVSARFGDDFAKSNINEKVQKIENNIQKIENNYKTNLQENMNLLKKEIEIHKKEFNEELDNLNDTQAKAYNKYYKLLEDNEKQIEEIKNILFQKETKIANLNKQLEEYLKISVGYKEDTQEELDNLDKKINKINYNGITNKFDKMLRDQNKKIDSQMIGSEHAMNNKIANLKKDIDVNEKKLADDIIKLNSSVQNNAININNIDKKLEESTLNINSSIRNNAITLTKLEEILNKELPEIKQQEENTTLKLAKNIENSNELSQEITKLYKNIQKNEEELNSFNLKLVENDNNLKNESKNTEIIVNSLDEKLTDKIKEITNLSEKNIKTLEENIENNNILHLEDIKRISEAINERKTELDNLSSDFIVKTEEINSLIKNNDNNLQKNIKELNKKLSELESENLKNNEKFTKNYKQTIEENAKSIEETLKQNIQQIEETLNESHATLNDNIQSNKDCIAKINENVEEKITKVNESIQLYKDTITKLKEEYEGNNEKINNNFEKFKNNVINENKKQKEDLNAKIKSESKKNKEDIKAIATSIEEVKTNLESTIENTQQEILKLQEETNSIKGKQNDKTDINELKKTYSQYVKKVDGALDKINQFMLGMHDQNAEANKNLQIKIKAYIDSKNTNTINGLKDTISKLNLSIIEREKLQKIEMEQLLNEKLKEMQKENERILNKKIEEINNAMRKNLSYYRTNNVEPIDNYKKMDKPKKNMYEPIDSNVILKQTASSNRKIETPETGKSQILKFFYDDEDIN